MNLKIQGSYIRRFTVLVFCSFYTLQGSQYYKYNDKNNQVEEGYPKSINEGWHGIPNKIDAAFTLSNQYSYFFKGNQVYKFDNNNDEVVNDYPKPINSEWESIPSDINKIDTAVRYYYDGVTYFFKGLKYWKWNNALEKFEGPYDTHTKWKTVCTV